MTTIDWAKLAARAAFRRGNLKYCGFSNPVTPGMWAGGIVGVKAILGVRSKQKAQDALARLAEKGYLNFAAEFPDAPEGTTLRTVGEGAIEASTPEGSAMWYNSALFQEPEAPHSVIPSANGTPWYAMEPQAEAPAFDSGEDAAAFNQAQLRAFLPDYTQQITAVDGSQKQEGRFEVRHEDGSGRLPLV